MTKPKEQGSTVTTKESTKIDLNKVPVRPVYNLRKPKNVRSTFLELIQFTTPHPFETDMFKQVLTETGWREIKDKSGHSNWEKVVGTSKTLFVAHLDTAISGGQNSPQKVDHIASASGEVYSVSNTILGADDKAGVALLLYLIAWDVPGVYRLVYGEEVGTLGSTEDAKTVEQGQFERVVCFDRQGYRDVITHQLGQETASIEFATALSKELNNISNGVLRYAPCDGGVYTDSVSYAHVVPECTNISVGYHNAHRNTEWQDIEFLWSLAEVLRKVDWEALPTVRNPEPRMSKWGYDDYALRYKLNLPVGKYEGMDMWGIYSVFESMELDTGELADWVSDNPERAAEFIQFVLQQNPTVAIDAMASVEGGR